jgi:hypothetical protein
VTFSGTLTYNLQRWDKGWFDRNDNPISPLTSQERGNIDAALATTGSRESPISVSDAYTAMEFYRFADSSEAFFELSSVSLAHLYLFIVQHKSDQYDHMNADEKKTWNESQMKKIRRRTKKALIDALMGAVRVDTIFI